MKRSAARYGDTFTMRLADQGPMVMMSHPDAVREVFTAPTDLMHAGEANRILLPVEARTRYCCSTATPTGNSADY